MKLVLTTIALLACMSALEAQENPVFRQPEAQLRLLNKKPLPKQQPFLAPVDTIRGNIAAIPKQTQVYNMPVLKPDIVYNIPNAAHTPQYKTIMLERYGDTATGRMTRKPLAK